MDRRRFLRRTGTALGGAALSAVTAPWSRVIAGPCTDFGFYNPHHVWDGGWSAGAAPSGGYKILEIFCAGGMSPWETFYTRGNDPFRGFAAAVQGLVYNGGNSDDCDAPAPTNGTQTLPFAVDDAGAQVDLGPWTKPLWTNTILDKMRIVVLRHDLTPHEAAVPFAITGKPLGRPGFAHLGSHITRRKREQTGFCALDVPTSYTIGGTHHLGLERFRALSATGQNSAVDRSLILPYPSGALFDDLTRAWGPGEAALPPADHLLSVYTEMYRDRLRFPVGNSVPRGQAFARYSTTFDAMRNWTNLKSLLDVPVVSAQPFAQPRCVNDDVNFDAVLPNTRRRLEGAAYLLKDPRVHHVTVGWPREAWKSRAMAASLKRSGEASAR